MISYLDHNCEVFNSNEKTSNIESERFILRLTMALITNVRYANGANVQGGRGAEGHDRRERTLAVPLATAMVVPSLRPFHAAFQLDLHQFCRGAYG
jgi:hypothetical protein